MGHNKPVWAFFLFLLAIIAAGPGPIALISTWNYRTVAGSKRTILVGVPFATIKQGLSGDDLADLKRHYDTSRRIVPSPDSQQNNPHK
jgi:hypothetical protein